MERVSTEEIINYKILPFNIYSEFGEKLFSAGEVLTPGKLLQIRNLDVLYCDTDEKENSTIANEILPEPPEEPIIQKEPTEQKQDIKEEKIEEVEEEVATKQTEVKPQEPTKNKGETSDKSKEKEEVFIQKEAFDMNPSTIQRNKLTVDDIDISGYKGPINKKSAIAPQTQLKIKAFYLKTLEIMDVQAPVKMISMLANIRDKIIQDILTNSASVMMSSQFKLLGEYKRCHALNTAILSGALAKSMDLSESVINDIVLASLIHDIGKSKLSPELLSKTSYTQDEQKEYQSHTKLGYKIIRAEMKLPENIAKIALDHHEYNDGSGYPYGKSGDRISIETQIVNVCNYFDNLTSNRTPYQVKNTKEAIRIMLQLGTKKFSAKPLYTFVHMFSYNDTTNFEEMIL